MPVQSMVLCCECALVAAHCISRGTAGSALARRAWKGGDMAEWREQGRGAQSREAYNAASNAYSLNNLLGESAYDMMTSSDARGIGDGKSYEAATKTNVSNSPWWVLK
jgi:hypothetical protein